MLVTLTEIVVTVTCEYHPSVMNLNFDVNSFREIRSTEEISFVYDWFALCLVSDHFVLWLTAEAVVEYNYEAEQEDELTLHVGDVIKHVITAEGGWWEGELNGKKGMFPENFVRVSWDGQFCLALFNFQALYIITCVWLCLWASLVGFTYPVRIVIVCVHTDV